MNKEIILLHGLNNCVDCFYPLGTELEKHGFKVHYFTLKGHDKVATDLCVASCLAHLKQQFDTLPEDREYVLIGFSFGGLSSLMLPNEIKQRISKQILLAPALFLNWERSLRILLNCLKFKTHIPSFTPEKLRQFPHLPLGYYRSIISHLDQFRQIPGKELNDKPTLIILDLHDELINSSKIKKMIHNYKLKNWNVLELNRVKLGSPWQATNHALFHPDYMEPADWNSMIEIMVGYINHSPPKE